MSNVSHSPRRVLAALIGVSFAVTMWSSDAWACRGTTEYPEVAQQLAAASLPDDRKAELTRQLEEGRALHDRAHQQNDTGSMRESLTILDRIKGAL